LSYLTLWDDFKAKYGEVRIWTINRVGKKRVHSWTKIRELMRELEDGLPKDDRERTD